MYRRRCIELKTVAVKETDANIRSFNIAFIEYSIETTLKKKERHRAVSLLFTLGN